MHIQITQVNLNRALSLLSRVASTRSTLPILANILLTATKGNLTAAASNLEVAISHNTKGKIEEEGGVTVPARLLSDFISQLPKDLTIDLVFDKNKLHITAGSYSSTIQGTAAEEFPALPVMTTSVTTEISVSSFKNMLTKTLLAASHDETRPILGGIYFHSSKNNLFAAATDGYRLAEYNLGTVQEQISAVVPLSALQDALKIAQDSSSESLQIQFDEGQFGLDCQDTTLVSRLVDGQFPEYKQLIPEKSDISFSLSKDDFLTAAKLAGLFARESGGSITISVSEKDKTVSVNSVATQVGDNSSVLNATVTGSGEVVLNVRYLTDALNCFDSDTVNFRFSGAISPCVITSDSQPEYQHIVMPLKS